MRNGIALFTALCISSTVIACSGKSNVKQPEVISPAPVNNQPAPAPQPPAPAPAPAAPTWTVKLQSKCAELVNEGECLAEHGFTVMANGQYQLGPAPSGKVKTGNLTPEELSALEQIISKTLTTTRTALEGHLAVGEADAHPTDVITLSRGQGSEETLVRFEGSDFNYALNSADDAKALHMTLHQLATKYYALPFPDQCMDQVDAYHTLLASLQSCAADSDCTYMSADLEAVAPSDPSFVFTDRCTLSNALPVANSKLAQTSADKLRQMDAEIENRCGERLYKADCQWKGFNPNNLAPVCQQGLCVVNPKVEIQ